MRQTAAARECPIAPPGQATVYARALHRACVIVGGVGPLAARMRVPEPLLEGWMRGEGEPPQSVFHEAVEIILLYAADGGRSN
jgi:hypothetical protein